MPEELGHGFAHSIQLLRHLEAILQPGHQLDLAYQRVELAKRLLTLFHQVLVLSQQLLVLALIVQLRRAAAQIRALLKPGAAQLPLVQLFFELFRLRVFRLLRGSLADGLLLRLLPRFADLADIVCAQRRQALAHVIIVLPILYWIISCFRVVVIQALHGIRVRLGRVRVLVHVFIFVLVALFNYAVRFGQICRPRIRLPPIRFKLRLALRVLRVVLVQLACGGGFLMFCLHVCLGRFQPHIIGTCANLLFSSSRNGLLALFLQEDRLSLRYFISGL